MVVQVLETFQEAVEDKDVDSMKLAFQALNTEVEVIKPLGQQFLGEMLKESPAFVHLQEYLNMVSLMLDLIQAERTCDWLLHL